MFHDWHAVVQTLALEKDKARKVRRGVVFCLREQLECKELCTGRGDEQAES